ncbi:MAG: Metallo-beta-lactamase family protein, RNA-specific, partial [uncultured Rubrobacteraceae bacterium]
QDRRAGADPTRDLRGPRKSLRGEPGGDVGGPHHRGPPPGGADHRRGAGPGGRRGADGVLAHGEGCGAEEGLRGRPRQGPGDGARAPEGRERAALLRLQGRQRAGRRARRGGRRPHRRAERGLRARPEGRGAGGLRPGRQGPPRRADRRAGEARRAAGAGARRRADGVLPGRGARGRAARGARARGRRARPHKERAPERPVHRRRLRRASGKGRKERGRRHAGHARLGGQHGAPARVYGKGPPGPVRPARPAHPGPQTGGGGGRRPRPLPGRAAGSAAGGGGGTGERQQERGPREDQAHALLQGARRGRGGGRQQPPDRLWGHKGASGCRHQARRQGAGRAEFRGHQQDRRGRYNPRPPRPLRGASAARQGPPRVADLLHPPFGEAHSERAQRPRGHGWRPARRGADTRGQEEARARAVRQAVEDRGRHGDAHRERPHLGGGERAAPVRAGDGLPHRGHLHGGPLLHPLGAAARREGHRPAHHGGDARRPEAPAVLGLHKDDGRDHQRHDHGAERERAHPDVRPRAGAGDHPWPQALRQGVRPRPRRLYLRRRLRGDDLREALRRAARVHEAVSAAQRPARDLLLGQHQGRRERRQRPRAHPHQPLRRHSLAGDYAGRRQRLLPPQAGGGFEERRHPALQRRLLLRDPEDRGRGGAVAGRAGKLRRPLHARRASRHNQKTLSTPDHPDPRLPPPHKRPRLPPGPGPQDPHAHRRRDRPHGPV